MVDRKPLCLVTNTKGSTYISHPLALFGLLSRNTLVVVQNKESWRLLASIISRFVPVVKTSFSLQFAIESKIFTVLNRSLVPFQEGYFYRLLGLQILWQAEIGVLTKLTKKSKGFPVSNSDSKGGLISKSWEDIAYGVSYDLVRFYAAIALDLDVAPVILRLVYINNIQKEKHFGQGLPNYFIGVLSRFGSGFSFITGRGRNIISIRVPYGGYKNKNVDSIW